MVALVINLEASKYSKTNYNKAISTATERMQKFQKKLANADFLTIMNRVNSRNDVQGIVVVVVVVVVVVIVIIIIIIIRYIFVINVEKN